MMATDDEVAIRYTISGTHEGEFMGVAPTGRKVEAAAMQIARFENGKVKERWGLTDQLGLLQQIGAVDELG
ncbi:MAG: ester cyclase [Rhodothermales bacterium]